MLTLPPNLAGLRYHGDSEALLRFLSAPYATGHLPLQLATGFARLLGNRCVMHNPVNDYHGQRRVLHRITRRGVAQR